MEILNFLSASELVSAIRQKHAPRRNEELENLEDCVMVEPLSATTGQLAIVLPVLKDKVGFPIGVQIIGRRWSDEKLVEIAKLIAEIIGGFQSPGGFG